MRKPILLAFTGATVGLLADWCFPDLLDSTWAWVLVLFFGNPVLAVLHRLHERKLHETG